MLKGIWDTWSNDDGVGGSLSVNRSFVTNDKNNNNNNNIRSVASTSAASLGGGRSSNNNFGVSNSKQRLQQSGLALKANHILELEDPNGSYLSGGGDNTIHAGSSDADNTIIVENEDELADRLLVQFPTYGSHSQALNSNNLNQTADWLLGGTSNIPNPSQQQKQQQRQQQQEQLEQQQLQHQQQQQLQMTTDPYHMHQLGPYADDGKQRHQLDSKMTLHPGDEWDEDEQILWKTSKLASLPRNHPVRSNNHHLTNNYATAIERGEANKANDDIENNNNHDKKQRKSNQQQRQLDQQQQSSNKDKDWLEDYYYHTGVTPKNHHRTYDDSSAFQQFAATRTSPHRFTSRMVSKTTAETPTRNTTFGTPRDKGGTPYSIITDDEDDDNNGVQLRTPPQSSSRNNTATSASRSSRRPTSPEQIINHQIIETPPKRLSPAATEPSTSLTTNMSDDRQHWMPDQLCKHCYACDTPFTVFRRRHHCRLCGQVFCNACSAFFVPANQQLHPNYHQQLNQQHQSNGGVNNSNTSSNSNNNSSNNNNNSNNIINKSNSGGSSSGGTNSINNSSNTSNNSGSGSSSNNNKTILRTCKMCFDQVTAQQQKMMVEGEAAADTGRKRKKKAGADDSSSLSPAIDPTLKPTSVQLSPQHHQTSNTLSGVSPSLQEQLEQTDSVLHSFSLRRKETAYAKRRLLSQQQAMEQEEKEATRLLQHHQHNLQQQQQQQQQQTRTGTLLPSVSISSPSRTGRTHQRQQQQQNFSSNATTAATNSDQRNDTEKESRRLGLAAATHLEKMGETLLDKDAPLLWKEVAKQQTEATIRGQINLKRKWINKIMSLATRCCATVEPNLKNGDLLDIRPYCKIKVIPGGSYQDCAYVSGIVFRKTLSHKQMAKEISDPRIMLLSGGIEFTRTENRIASLETLLEQEGKYTEILVGKILKLKPDVLMVGRSVSRRAQELLLKAKVVLLQHVKSALLSRVSRQTGATIISSTDHIMNQFGANVLGKCHRFRFIVARDNEVWVDNEDKDITILDKLEHADCSNSSIDHQPGELKIKKPKRRNIKALLQDTGLSNHERQAALAANMLGEEILDGSEAVKSGLSKRGVAQTYVMLEGCPKHLGCTVVLRGASQAALKQVKTVFRFLVNVAYNLKLERSYLQERCARLRPGFEVQPRHLFSSSMCVDYGGPSGGRRIRPWNGGGATQNDGSHRSISGKVTAFDHQSILITSVWMTDKTQCCPAEVKGICYYSLQDVSLGQFLRDSCFNLSLKCQNPTCKKSVLDHSLSFVHNDGLINITVDHMDDPLPPAPLDGSRKMDDSNRDDDEDSEEIEDSPIATWTYCKNCAKVVTPLVYISENTWKLSFGKFLESFFYNHDVVMNSPEHHCRCDLQTSTTLFFGCGQLAARFTYERVRPFGVFVRRSLPIDTNFHRADALRQLGQISMASSLLFVKFDKHIEKVSREARSLFGSAANRPEHLQTVLSELNRIGSEVDHAAKTLQEKIASVSDKCSQDDDGVVNEALFRFPWFSRRYLFMLTSAWNEKLSAAGQAIVAMKKLASSASQRGDIVMGPNVPAIVGDPNTEELHEGMRRLRQLHEVYSRYNLTDITTILPIIPGNTSTPRNDIELDDDFEDPDGAIHFADGVDADVVASRRRLYNGKAVSINQPQGDRSEQNLRQRPAKMLGTRRADDKSPSRRSTAQETAISSTTAVSAKVTPGGAVKSAITRFFNRGGRESDPYVVDLGIFNEGRPRLEPGVNGIVVPVMDEQLCTVIAYSLSSTEYANQFQDYAKVESTNPEVASEAGVAAETASTTSTAGIGGGGAGSQQRGRANSKPPHNQKHSPSSSQSPSAGPSGLNDKQGIERRMLVRNKSHIKHTFRDFDEKGQNLCKFVCTTYWATQFHAVRQVFLSPNGGKDSTSGGNLFGLQCGLDVEQSYVQSLSSAYSWAASGGKSGASFARTSDDRFVIKCISRTELQMFLDCAPAYFEYLSKAFFHGLPTVLCKIVGVYQIGYHNRETGKRSMEQVAVMQNIFYNRKITKIFDLKGSLRGRFAAQVQSAKDDIHPDTPTHASDVSYGNRKRGSDPASSDSDFPRVDGESEAGSDGEEMSGSGAGKGQTTGTLLDGDFLDFTAGRPMPMNDRAKAVFHMSILNDTLFLSIINVLDYSILVGIDEERMELVVGIIDFMRQYDILKQMERVGKSLPMVVGSEAPTIIQPPLYKARFTNAMERYFMTVPSKWTTI